MATQRQIEANRRNSERSTGPKTEDGKARSRVNATKHGLAGELAESEAGFSDEFLERREKWGAELAPDSEADHWALDRVVASSFRIERCEHALDDLTTSAQLRARLAWDEDRAIEAAKVAGRLAKNPVLASRELQATLAGVMLLIDAWISLVATLQTGKDWSDSEASRALDLLGVAPDARSGPTMIDSLEGQNPIEVHRKLVLEEVDRLEALRDEALIPLDLLERRQAMAGNLALLSKPAKLVLRYERDAWRRYRESMSELKNPTTPPAVATPPKVVEVVEVVAPAPPESLEESARPEARARQLDVRDPLPGSFVPISAAVTERSQFGGELSPSSWSVPAISEVGAGGRGR